MRVDPIYCMNSYLTYRTIVDQECSFSARYTPWFYHSNVPRVPINSADELDAHLRARMEQALNRGSVALMLSSGMDSAILASYLPAGTQTYTLHCVSSSGIDETDTASVYAKKNHLKHTVVDVYWEDFLSYSTPLMRQKGYPIHSIEVQIHKAALQAQKDGIDTLIFGETADILYGGHSKLLSRDWTSDEFYQRFSFVDVTKVLRHPAPILSPILPYEMDNGNIDVFRFLNDFEYNISLGFYTNACALSGISFFAPYSDTFLGQPLDLSRIRNGEGKYIIRELFQKKYPDMQIPAKTPLPRPMSEWLKDWNGPLHPEIVPDHISELSGDQKWYVYALNSFLTNLIEE